MIWLALALMAACALVPLAITLRGRGVARGARDMAMALHRGQLTELDRDLAEGRILPAEHATAVLEVQRRLLAVAADAEAPPASARRLPVIAAMVLVPLAALGLYALGGQPFMPSVSGQAQQAQASQEQLLIAQLRAQLASMDPASDRARQGYVLLGNVEEARGNDRDAVTAWRRALQTQFDPTLAVRTAEAEVRVNGGVAASSAALYRQALAAQPDAPWRAGVEARLKQAPPAGGR